MSLLGFTLPLDDEAVQSRAHAESSNVNQVVKERADCTYQALPLRFGHYTRDADDLQPEPGCRLPRPSLIYQEERPRMLHSESDCFRFTGTEISTERIGKLPVRHGLDDNPLHVSDLSGARPTWPLNHDFRENGLGNDYLRVQSSEEVELADVRESDEG